MDKKLSFSAQVRTAQNQPVVTAQPERTPELLWINVGYWVTGSNGEPLFVSLPLGIALTSMKEAIGSSDLAKAKNNLRNDLIAFGMGLAPGETSPLPELELQLRRVDEEHRDMPTEIPRITFGKR